MSRQLGTSVSSGRIGALVLVLLAGAVVACGEKAKPDPTKTFLDVVDINAKVAPPPPPPPLVGKMSVFSTPIGGNCKVTRFRGKVEVARELWYDADNPRRTIVLSFGRSLRLYPPLALEITATQGNGVTNEQETVVVGFGGDSTVQFGTRSYQSTGREEAGEKVQLSELDKVAAVRFANELMALCPDALR